MTCGDPVFSQLLRPNCSTSECSRFHHSWYLLGSEQQPLQSENCHLKRWIMIISNHIHFRKNFIECVKSAQSQTLRFNQKSTNFLNVPMPGRHCYIQILMSNLHCVQFPSSYSNQDLSCYPKATLSKWMSVMTWTVWQVILSLFHLPAHLAQLITPSSSRKELEEPQMKGGDLKVRKHQQKGVKGW